MRRSLLVIALIVSAAVAVTAGAWADDSQTTSAGAQATPAPAPAAESSPEPAAAPPAPTAADNQKEIERLQAEIAALEKRLASVEGNVAKNWDPNRDGVRLGEKIWFTFHGEFRSRAIIEANTKNAYTNYAGERLYAYDPKSTLENDYGWWDSRLQVRTGFNFANRAELVAMIQFGDVNWGSQTAAFGESGTSIYDKPMPYFRELYARVSMDPIPMTLVFGRVPIDFIGNRLIIGYEHNGAYTYFGPRWLQFGFGGFRDYEGEPYEYGKRYNDDEDMFLAWLNTVPAAGQKLQFFGWMRDLIVAAKPVQLDQTSPLYSLPGFTQDKYTGQNGQVWDVGVNWVGDFGPVTLNAEIDQEIGVLPASHSAAADGARDIHFNGRAAFLKTDWHVDNLDCLALTGGYGSGDNPKSQNYSGFWAPDNEYIIRDFYREEPIQRGTFMVYNSIAPGAGVPGALKQNLGTGGIENTIFANLAADLGIQDNHHYYISWGYIRAAEPNPVTHSADIGWEMDARVDYLFNSNVTFSIYGGHLFMTGNYFREHAHDAAAIFFEWKLSW
jgi:hypothetical protein